MKNLVNLSAAQKILFFGHAIVAFGAMVASLGTLLSLAQSGNLPQEPFASANTVASKTSTQASTRYFMD